MTLSKYGAGDFRALFERDIPEDFRPGRVTAVILAYNEGLRFPHFLDHHKKLGVERFIVVDNASTDNTSELLAADPTVLRLPTSKPYKENKALWREVIGDVLLANHWALFLDVDELLVYPGWPDHSINWFCDYLEQNDYEALFTTMVDMYPAGPLDECAYEVGTPFLDAAPMFDGDGYRLLPLAPAQLKSWPTPPYRIFGGARERLFWKTGKSRKPTLIDRAILRAAFPLSRSTDPGPARRKLDARALDYVDGSMPSLSPANMSKVPLIKWRVGSRLPGGVHRWNLPYSLAPDWGALLHFKYLDDFGRKVSEAVERGQHAADAAHYRAYAEQLGDVVGQPLTYSRSKTFTGVDSLASVGLMRVSPQLRQFDLASRSQAASENG